MFPDRVDLPPWLAFIFFALAAFLAWRNIDRRKRGISERPADGGFFVNFLTGFLVVVLLHFADLLPSLSRKHDIVGNVFTFIGFVVWNIALIALVAFPLGWVFRKVPRGTAWSIRITLWSTPLLFIGVHYLLNRPGEPAAPPPPAAAEPVAAATPTAEPSALNLEVENLRISVEKKWREDLEAAGAVGMLGSIPPMLEVKQSGPHLQITNRGGSPVSVQLARVVPARKQTGYLRCVFDGGARSEIPSLGTRRLQLFSTGTSEECIEGQLEFRIGTPTSPEPSWWTHSALDDLTQMRLDDFTRYRQLSPVELVAESSRLEAQLHDVKRAERWRSTLSVRAKAR